MALKPPVEVPHGAIRLNTDSQKMEFFAQDQWWEMATDVPTLNGGARGIWASGNYHPSGINIIDYVTISTAGNAVDFGDTSDKWKYNAGCASRTRGISAGGISPSNAPAYTNVMEYVTIASTGNAADFGDLTLARILYSATSDSHGGLS